MNKRIAFLQPHLTLAVGSTILLLEICKRMARKGWDVSVISSRSDLAITATAREAGVRFVDVGGPISSSLWFWLFFPFIYRKVQRAIRQTGANIVVSGAFPAVWWGWLYKYINPRVFHVFYCFEPSAFIYNPDWTKSVKPFYMRWGLILFKPLLQFIEKQLYPHTDHTVAISDFTKQELLRVYPTTNRATLTRIYCGISHDVFYDPELLRLPQIVIMGTLTRFKNADWVIRALALLKQDPQFQQATLVIKGKGEEKANLIHLVEELGLQESVTIIDTYFTNDQLRTLLGSSRVVVHAAHNEAFGLAPVEAMACGTPAVVTGSGGTGETVVNGVSGLYFQPGNIDDLARQLKKLLGDESYWRNLSAGAIARADEFSWDKNTHDFCELLMHQSVTI
ncbi:glycosyltransferase family 4 protein [Fibrella forsythiae]|uniref:Glycosyltransferase family 4 protein n=1 Tax=Fibrella forsythiae TaxID=2817061 RepID=A0ABS3JMD3_9BACT|nr:glycosyltransferase family 4 protein [Fibrella forsythiae]MBO0950057.1 glycosyltransferase family 4 protein [Fibrella forsythiae]